MKPLRPESSFSRSLPHVSTPPCSLFELCHRNVFCILGVISIFSISLASSQTQPGDAPPEASTSPTESQQVEAQQRRVQQIDEDRAAGRIGPLEAELQILLLNQDNASPQAHREAILTWQAEKGDALERELEELRAQERPRLEAQEAESQSRRQKLIERERVAGRISSLETEFQDLLNREHQNPEERQQEIRDWNREKGAALLTELMARRARERPRRETQEAEVRARRQQHIAREVAAGRIGPLEAELLNLLNRDYPTPQARHEAMQAWRIEKFDAFKDEQESRRQTTLSGN